jgi:ribosomal protein S18 acetylase RimI-like enzyme
MLNMRMVDKNDLLALQNLYVSLHETEIMPVTSDALKTWEEILETPDYYILVGEERGVMVSSVTLVIIKNLTRKMRPYALIENVVTASAYRKKGYATCLLKKAVEIAREHNCYKIMLLSGSKNESTLRLYKNAGFADTEKKGFIMRL